MAHVDGLNRYPLSRNIDSSRFDLIRANYKGLGRFFLALFSWRKVIISKPQATINNLQAKTHSTYSTYSFK